MVEVHAVQVRPLERDRPVEVEAKVRERTKGDVDVLIPHQANKRIILSVAERLGMDLDRVIINIDRFGNTTGATIPLATRDAVESGRVSKGDIVLFAAVGAGFTAGANLWRWAY